MGNNEKNVSECPSNTTSIEINSSPPATISNDKKGKTTIYDLPRQIWLEIYLHIDYASYLNLRLTCSHFLFLIDNYLGVRGNFTTSCSSDPDAFQFLTSVALTDVQFDDAKDMNKFNLKNILAFPNFLNEVSFSGNTNLQLIQDIAVKCASLQLVEMTIDCKILGDNGQLELDSLNYFFPGINYQNRFPPTVCYFRDMEVFKLVPGIQTDNIRSKVVLSLLRATRSGDCLRKVIFQTELDEEVTLTNLLCIEAELMEQHSKLDALFMAITNDEFLLPEGSLPGYPYLELENEQEFKYFRNRIVSTGSNLKIRKMGLTIINPSMQIIWGDFLKTQQHLVHLSLTVNIGSGTFSQEFFNSFSETLEQLAVRGKFEEPFDFGHISNCRNLKEVCLHNLQENGGGIIPRCVNMAEIPDGLESLILFQVVTRTEEIRQTLQKLENLSTLVVFKCGHAAGETGVGLECLQEVLHKRTLHSILIVQFICGSTSEAEKLAGVLYNMAKETSEQRNGIASRGSIARNNVPFPENEPEVIIDLPEVVGDNEDEILFVSERNSESHLQRPVSRGAHRNSNDTTELSEASGECLETVVEVWKRSDDKPDDENENEMFQNATAYPPTPTFVEESVFTEDDFPPLELNLPIETTSQQVEEENRDNEIENSGRLEDNSNDQPGNILQDILEHAIVDDPNLIEQRHPNLQDNMVLNRIHEFNDDVELILDIDVIGNQDIGPVLDLFAAERLARAHNVQVGFILDGVIDIMNEDMIRSKWLCVEDEDGHLTYTLKISVEL